MVEGWRGVGGKICETIVRQRGVYSLVGALMGALMGLNGVQRTAVLL